MTVRTASEGGTPSPVLIPILCLLLVIGLVQVIRPQLLWRLNSRLQRGWVKNPEATEPTRKGYAVQRVSGVLFLAGAVWMLVLQF
ncbi:DUF6199 family natural product biosynthesis protein [Streptomyces sp. SID10815]|uniref:DUF6199 family natural product biosynthesis protein n=1 Tax=Streptomyces sp. SID10815 TaxID=2706027 RepID=UPI0013CB66EF|nr:DUF6199 family natural product biosynthesis protein [Streptomyces sp. SID10815]NEA45844.1 hypothetical protein [Streptomyces sp. SID10815]